MPSSKVSKRIRRELMANQSLQKDTPGRSALVAHGEIHGEIRSGPIPDPETLERYKNADPTFPERIMKMAEAHNAADVKIKNRFSMANFLVPIIGQVFTLLLGVAGIFACIYLAKAGFTGGAITAIIGAFSPIAINAVKGLRPNRK
jgi:uncharacterized membrane protein